jgi:hypothetical protein
MGINSTEVSYGFGQLGSAYTTSSSDAIKPPTGKVFVAIQMLTDTVFDSSGGLVAEQRVNNTITSSVTNNVYIGTEAAANDLAAGSETVDEGSGGKVVDSVTFPKGVVIYGRWSEIDVSDGSIVAYIGD